MSDDILSRLHTELEGTMANSPAVWELLFEAREEIERLRVRLAARERFLKALRAARDKRDGERRDDDGAPEVILTGRQRGPAALPLSRLGLTPVTNCRPGFKTKYPVST